MGWRDWFGIRSDNATPSHAELKTFLFEGEELVQVAGESFYQPALLQQCGARRGDEVRFRCRACLVAQPDNPHDPNAVAVQIGGHLVGHLSRREAPDWQPLVRTLAASGYLPTCEAMIAGRGRTG